MPDKLGLSSILATVAFLIVVVVGGVVVITNPDGMDAFKDYAIAVGVGAGGTLAGAGLLGQARNGANKDQNDR